MTTSTTTTLGHATTLGPADTAEVERIALELCSWGTEQVDDPAWVAEVRQAAAALPVALRRALRRFRRHSGPTGTLLLHGLPVDAEALPPTPTVDGSVQRLVTVPAAVLMLVACELGDPAAFLA
jgi:L-asparagine oxygenase